MATIIDELILTLGFDTRGLDEGQRRAVRSLRTLETEASRSAGHVRDSGSGVVSFFKGLESPLASLRGHFERLATATTVPKQRLTDLAAQGRRTGTSIEAGALTGAAGLRAMSVAGLGAFAALTALSKLMEKTGEQAQKTFNSGVGAAAAQLPVQTYSAIQRALFRRGVPQEETGALLDKLALFKANAARGYFDPGMATAFAQAGITDYLNPKTGSDRLMTELASAFSGMDPTRAVSIGGSLGISQNEVIAMRRAGTGFAGEVANAGAGATTDLDVGAAGARKFAEAGLSNSMDRLWQVIGTDLTPQIVRLADFVSKIVDYISKTEAVRSSIGNALLGLLPGGGIAGAARSILGGGGSSGAGPQSSLGPSGSDAVDAALAPIIQRESGGNPNIGWGGTDLSNASLSDTGFPVWAGNPGPAGNSTAAGLYQITRSTWDPIARKLGIHDFSPASQRTVARELYGQAGLTPWGGAAYPRAAPAAATVPVGGASSAVDDMLRMNGLTSDDPRIRQFIKENGGDLNPAQAAWCAAFLQAAYQHEGIAGGKGNVATSWATFGSSVNASQAQKGDVVTLTRGLAPGDTGGHVGLFTGVRDADGNLQIVSGNHGDAVGKSWVNPALATIRRAGAGSVTNSNSSQTTHVGSIHVHTQATTAAGIAAAGMMAANMAHVTQSNTGLVQ